MQAAHEGQNPHDKKVAPARAGATSLATTDADDRYCGTKQAMVVVIVKFDWVVWRSAKKKSSG